MSVCERRVDVNFEECSVLEQREKEGHWGRVVVCRGTMVWWGWCGGCNSSLLQQTEEYEEF